MYRTLSLVLLDIVSPTKLVNEVVDSFDVGDDRCPSLGPGLLELSLMCFTASDALLFLEFCSTFVPSVRFRP